MNGYILILTEVGSNSCGEGSCTSSILPVSPAVFYMSFLEIMLIKMRLRLELTIFDGKNEIKLQH